MDKYEIAQILREIGIIIELTDDNPKKGITYRRASSSVESISDLEEGVKGGHLPSLPGIGSKISEMITTLFYKGRLDYYDKLKSKIPAALLDLAQGWGINLKKLRVLYENYHVSNINQLEDILTDESIKLRGFSPSAIKKMRKRITLFKTEGYAVLYPRAFHICQAFLEILKNYTKKIEITGSLRRKLETITHIDLIAIPINKEECTSIFVKHGLVKEILSKDSNKVSVLLKSGIIANLHIVEEHEYYLSLLNLTGNEDHIQALEKEAINKGYPSLNALNTKKIKDEGSLYSFLNLSYIPPELREGFGEVEVSEQKRLPHLIEVTDLKGTFHCHTLGSDGTNTIEELVLASKRIGWEYIGISDHSKSSYQANGMDELRLFEQVEKIRELNSSLDPSFHIFSGVECDILKDGQLDFSDEILKRLDFVIVSIHSYFKMEEEEMTKRLIRAIENPYSTMVGHLTGRLLLHRDPYKLNIPKILDACVANDKIIELNAYPSRLDMDWRWWIEAKKKGLKCSINPDAHSLNELFNCNYGVHMARKGWLEKEDVINTLSLQEMKHYFEKKKGLQ